MREMHKWKDKVELSLDNRQIFFLFFGLSVVGCFVFALGVMVGRRVEWSPEGEVAALSGDGLALLQDERAPGEPLTFKEGLQEPATDEVPATRDPGQPPRDEDEVKAEKAAQAQAAAGKPGASKPVPVAAPAVPAADPTLARGGEVIVKGDPSADSKKFTLQMKAFARVEEADAFAARLRGNGHQVRVEPHEVKGRIWHRVRMGSYDNWADGLAAKQDFEAREKIIAYVVKQ
ncbi:SPOR domain-containing protein [Paraliomyxa miuraensis]|uniref:SPOR domain-containing protein n=1 Tax=Paraliomyxa miuraensis TaxID=376150 RepID=UPI00225BA9A6|nr:SPOR domain-containing protein [Paraliomyxa miuraensis]MCX4245652.1 SPOR domain-containing protein [Paraliomyxa miuraensis]